MMQFLLDNIVLVLIIVIAAGALVFPYFAKRGAGPEVSVKDVVQLINRQNAMMIDVRKPEEYRRGHIAQAVNIPADVIQGRLADLPKDRPIILVDTSGAGSRAVARLLRGVGFKQTSILEGGLFAWTREKMPLES